ncbi:MAG: hypothetical protein AB1330_07105 [Bacillota bacterium]
MQRWVSGSSKEIESNKAGRRLNRLIAEKSPYLLQARTILWTAIGCRALKKGEVVIAGNLRADDAKAMPAVLRRQFVPDKVVLLRPTGKKAPANTRLAGFTRNLAAREGQPPTSAGTTSANCR